MQDDPPVRTAPDISRRRPASPSRALRKLIPFVVMLFMAFVIVKDRFPVVNDAIMGLVSPSEQKAIELCREEALQRSTNPRFTRLIKLGKATQTPDGFVINKLVIGIPDENQGEKRMTVTCHVGSEGAIANYHMAEVEPPEPAAAVSVRPIQGMQN